LAVDNVNNDIPVDCVVHETVIRHPSIRQHKQRAIDREPRAATVTHDPTKRHALELLSGSGSDSGYPSLRDDELVACMTVYDSYQTSLYRLSISMMSCTHHECYEYEEEEEVERGMSVTSSLKSASEGGVGARGVLLHLHRVWNQKSVEESAPPSFVHCVFSSPKCDCHCAHEDSRGSPGVGVSIYRECVALSRFAITCYHREEYTSVGAGKPETLTRRRRRRPAWESFSFGILGVRLSAFNFVTLVFFELGAVQGFWE
jgi:hypothetical protein